MYSENFYRFLLISFLVLISGLPAFSQMKNNKSIPDHKSFELQKINSGLQQTPQNIFSEDEKQIMKRMEQIKNSDNGFPQGDVLLDLQKKIEKSNGTSYTDSSPLPFGTLIPASRLIGRQTDNLVSTQIFNPNNVPLAKAFQVEQRGATAGKQWLAVGYANGDTGVLARPDTLALYYSTDNGNSFSLFAMVAFSDHNKFTFDDMDMEIIENTTGTKYIHIVFGYQTNGGYGQRLIGYTVISVPTLGYAGTTFFPPGYNSGSQYFQARITSDNARYPSNPYLTIVFSQDSVANNQSHIMTKMCRVLNPFTISPFITYLPKCIYNLVPGSNGYDVTTDVANYHNGNDSLIFVLSNYPGFENTMYFYKAGSNAVVYPVPAGGFNLMTGNLEYARIAASGGTNQTQIMITFSNNYVNSGDFDQWILKTGNTQIWYGESLDFTTYNSSRFGDIIGKRNINGSFNITFKNFLYNMENVAFASYSDNLLFSSVKNVNTNYANSYCSPKPGFRYVQNDSCQILWSDFYRTYSTTGCSAIYTFVTAALEGYYNENTDEHSQYLPVNVLLADPSPPYNIIDTGLAYLDYQHLINIFTFPNAPAGNYYLVLKFYNTVETWSYTSVNVDASGNMFYDFTGVQYAAYGGNLTLKGSRWCIYSGDVNQDGVIDLDDNLQIDNDAFNFVMQQSYFTDLNGDNIVDIADIVIADNNAANFVSVIRP